MLLFVVACCQLSASLTFGKYVGLTTKNQFCASFYVFHSKNCKSSAVDVSLQGIFLCLHSIWSINARWNVVCLLMGHTANFAQGWLTSSGIVPKECLECHEFVGP